MLNIIKSRRSIRKFDSKTINKDDLRDLLEAAMYAPSAGNEQAWQFIVLEGEMLKKYLDQNRNVPNSTPFGILVCADRNLEKFKDFKTSYLDCSAAIQNILLVAHSKGLGAVWCYVFPTVVDSIKEMLGIPPNIEPFSFVSLGYPKEIPKIDDTRFVESKIHYNKW